MDKSKIKKGQPKQVSNNEPEADNSQVSPDIGNTNVSGSGFRIVELDGKFTIEREFEKSDYTWFLFWIIKEKKRKVWKRVTKTGGECFRLPLLGTGIVLDTYKDMLPAFDSMEEAERVVQQFINPPQPVYHYR